MSLPSINLFHVNLPYINRANKIYFYTTEWYYNITVNFGISRLYVNSANEGIVLIHVLDIVSIVLSVSSYTLIVFLACNINKHAIPAIAFFHIKLSYIDISIQNILLYDWDVLYYYQFWDFYITRIILK